MSSAIIVRNLAKRYRVKKRISLLRSHTEVIEALRGIDFTVNYGEVVGLLGPNGAGKTTTIKILATLLLPDSGEAYVAGYNVIKNAGEVRKRIGIMLTVEKGFYGKLTGRENLEYFAALYGLDRVRSKDRIDYLIRLLELDKLGADYKLLEEFSLGMKARLSLARALLSDAPVLLLDEPTLGLDPPSARRIRELVRDLAHKEGKAVLYTTHNMFEAELVCDRILLINKGMIAAWGTPQELKMRIPKLRVIAINIKGEGRVDRILESLGVKYEIKSEENSINSIRIHAERPEDVFNDVVRKFIASGFEIVSARIEEPTLEDVFIYFSEGSL
ncbi:MAG: ABC transporter ATP-binding protein [Ignisphaera sp.]|nr:ABC transporter ATP-binding protein [Ignisphaera sp.]MCX8167539.1 ABC transporter ATP-binding protein [Ignisphaera sp.]MDW8086009.1 ABC transporter ATP-binding protein [Ignisphaera sp.]